MKIFVLWDYDNRVIFGVYKEKDKAIDEKNNLNKVFPYKIFTIREFNIIE